MRDGLLLGIDGGQTATKSLLARLDGTVLATGTGGPFDHFHSSAGAAKNRAALQGAIHSTLTAAHARPEDVLAIGLGLTGVFSGADSTPVVMEIVRDHLPTAAITVRPDFTTNLAGASGGKPGVVVIAGGGAIAYGVTADGREGLSSGFGYLIGDEGSAFDIGRRAITSAARASDGRDPPTALEDTIRAAFNIDAIRDITRIVYGEGFSRERISQLAPVVVAAADAGDRAALRIVSHAGEELACAALAVIRQIHDPPEAPTVFVTGGLFQAGERLLAPFRSTLTRGWPQAVVGFAAHPPVVGALIEARRTAGPPVDSTWLSKVASTRMAIAS